MNSVTPIKNQKKNKIVIANNNIAGNKPVGYNVVPTSNAPNPNIIPSPYENSNERAPSANTIPLPYNNTNPKAPSPNILPNPFENSNTKVKPSAPPIEELKAGVSLYPKLPPVYDCKPITTGSSESYKTARNYVESYKDETEDYTRQLQAKAQELFEIHGAICDNEGFYQHTGECWNDALQQVLFNTDRIKEIVQKKIIYYNFYNEANSARFMPTSLLIKNLEFGSEFDKDTYMAINCEILETTKEWLILYLREMQKRFLRHYINEVQRRKIKQQICSEFPKGKYATDQLKKLSQNITLRKGGLEAKRSAILGKVETNKYNSKYRPTVEEYTSKKYAGGSNNDLLLLLNVINYYFFDNKLYIELLTTHEIKTIVNSDNYEILKTSIKNNLNGILFSVNNILKQYGHQMAFYQCGKNTYLYEDNQGIIEFNWRDFLITYIDLLKEHDHVSILICKFYFKEKNKDEIIDYAYYPILQYEDKSNANLNKKTILFYKNKIFDISDKDGFSTTTVNLDLDDVLIYGTVDGILDMTVEDFISIQLEPQNDLNKSKENKISNIGKQLNNTARIRRNVISSLFDENNEWKLLDMIDFLPKKSDLKIYNSKIGKEVPIVNLAASRGFEELAIKLIDKGYNYDEDVMSLTPLKYSIQNNMFNLFEKLLPKVNINEKDEELGFTPLHFSAIQKDDDPTYAMMLIDAGADVNTQSKTGKTPLYMAVVKKNTKIVKYLMCVKRADIFINDEAGKSVLDILLFSNDREYLEILTKCDPLFYNTEQKNSNPNGGFRKQYKKSRKLKRKVKQRSKSRKNK